MTKGPVAALTLLYHGLIGRIDRVVPIQLQPLWNSPAGPRTVFFWAPLVKWTIIFAGLGDILNRPAQNISLRQCGIIATTGLIWSRWSLVIKPKNYNLFAVNIVVFLTQGFLLCRALKWQHEQYTNAVNYAEYESKNPYYAVPMDDEW